MNDEQPTQPLTGCELNDIEGRWSRYVALRDPDSMETSVHDVPDLLAEVNRLRIENHTATEENSALLRKLEGQYRLRAENARLRAENAAIVKLHQPTAMNSWGHRTCTECDTPGYYQEWPCPTLVALGFEEQ